VSETTVGTNLLQSLEIITELRVHTVREDLVVFAVNDILLSVEEPRWDFELRRVLDDGDNSLQLVRIQITRSIVRK
jgi:hypothetical protein